MGPEVHYFALGHPISTTRKMGSTNRHIGHEDRGQPGPVWTRGTARVLMGARPHARRRRRPVSLPMRRTAGRICAKRTQIQREGQADRGQGDRERFLGGGARKSRMSHGSHCTPGSLTTRISSNQNCRPTRSWYSDTILPPHGASYPVLRRGRAQLPILSPVYRPDKLSPRLIRRFFWVDSAWGRS
jgi:hypothetical protein